MLLCSYGSHFGLQSSRSPRQNGSHTEATWAANRTLSSYHRHSSPGVPTFTVARMLTFLLCMVGSALVCFIVLKNPHMRAVTNTLIPNLAVRGLLVGTFCVPTALWAASSLVGVDSGSGGGTLPRNHCWPALLARKPLSQTLKIVLWLRD